MSHRIRRSVRRLADGRDLIYFDDRLPAPARSVTDERDLGPRAPAGQLRYDALVGDWVAVAAHRMSRTFLPTRERCPLCPTRAGVEPSEIPDHDYDVVVFENRFPSYAPVADDDVRERFPDRVVSPARGRTEVVCFTSDHEASFKDLTPTRARTVIEAWADRTAELSGHSDVEYVYCFENRGPEIGVTLYHPHGQIYAYPYLPTVPRQILARAEAHWDRTGRLLGADLLDAERTNAERLVMESAHWTAYVPFAARWPVEVHLVPNRDVPDLVALDDAERSDLATVYLDLLARLDRIHETDQGGPIELPYIAAWHQAPCHTGRQVSRLFLQVMSVLRSPGKLKYLAGSESGVGGWVNDTKPEAVAARLREVAPAATGRP